MGLSITEGSQTACSRGILVKTFRSIPKPNGKFHSSTWHKSNKVVNCQTVNFAESQANALMGWPSFSLSNIFPNSILSLSSNYTSQVFHAIWVLKLHGTSASHMIVEPLIRKIAWRCRNRLMTYPGRRLLFLDLLFEWPLASSSPVLSLPPTQYLGSYLFERMHM